VLPVFESKQGLLYYPVQYEGLEASPNIFYAGATTNQQIIPSVEYLLNEKKKTKFFFKCVRFSARSAEKPHTKG
jgi:urea transport system substrate-binding protein